jgi:hypothetical protein
MSTVYFESIDHQSEIMGGVSGIQKSTISNKNLADSTLEDYVGDMPSIIEPASGTRRKQTTGYYRGESRLNS